MKNKLYEHFICIFFFIITLAIKSEDEIKTSAFDAARQANPGHILGSSALLGHNMVNVHKDVFSSLISKSSL